MISFYADFDETNAHHDPTFGFHRFLYVLVSRGAVPKWKWQIRVKIGAEDL